ncbi:Uncharacterized protein Rs2_09454 [Raphanus sativus]|nr:Uncharacterized protein Rs2_09454 [Raphanus sativus]
MHVFIIEFRSYSHGHHYMKLKLLLVDNYIEGEADNSQQTIRIATEITACRSARHSNGRETNVFINKSSTVSTLATPTSLYFPSPSILPPLPLFFYRLLRRYHRFHQQRRSSVYPTSRRENLAVNSSSTFKSFKCKLGLRPALPALLLRPIDTVYGSPNQKLSFVFFRRDCLDSVTVLAAVLQPSRSLILGSERGGELTGVAIHLLRLIRGF